MVKFVLVMVELIAVTLLIGLQLRNCVASAYQESGDRKRRFLLNERKELPDRLNTGVKVLLDNLPVIDAQTKWQERSAKPLRVEMKKHSEESNVRGAGTVEFDSTPIGEPSPGLSRRTSSSSLSPGKGKLGKAAIKTPVIARRKLLSHSKKKAAAAARTGEASAAMRNEHDLLSEALKPVDSAYHSMATENAEFYSVCEEQLPLAASQVKPQLIVYQYNVYTSEDVLYPSQLENIKANLHLNMTNSFLSNCEFGGENGFDIKYLLSSETDSQIDQCLSRDDGAFCHEIKGWTKAGIFRLEEGGEKNEVVGSEVIRDAMIVSEFGTFFNDFCSEGDRINGVNDVAIRGCTFQGFSNGDTSLESSALSSGESSISAFAVSFVTTLTAVVIIASCFMLFCRHRNIRNDEQSTKPLHKWDYGREHDGEQTYEDEDENEWLDELPPSLRAANQLRTSSVRVKRYDNTVDL